MIHSWLWWLLLPALAASAGGCGWFSSDDGDTPAMKAVYNKTSGRLELLTYDTNKDNKTDIWNYMDATRLVRAEIDKNFDGVIDRWEYFTPDGALEKVGFSRANDGRVDAWAFKGPDGQMARIEVSTRRNGTVSRWEYYEKDALVRADEDANADGKVDKWEAHRAGSLASVAMDTNGDGKADRRLVYGPDGVTVEKLK
jgi:uncharacterized protein (DUF2141 family)